MTREGRRPLPIDTPKTGDLGAVIDASPVAVSSGAEHI
jgi:hypothetical protein